METSVGGAAFRYPSTSPLPVWAVLLRVVLQSHLLHLVGGFFKK